MYIIESVENESLKNRPEIMNKTMKYSVHCTLENDKKCI